ncbi:nucleoside triphosphate pyrophosphatase [Gordonia sp. (in: high G+C Gram-positive bacteria)]|uniref:Maf family protein n=1 Tax=Gordonia sp. (in: high G+C Gram-positive bacteria) TaxID=84139 RepID=UPI001699F65E|nr:Maf family protein [Gordonia sp. (in: high G+C Gram-positive bacteria)]NLG46741.1 septum formation inhibitor Maf [Gordonia sp. (in: high G+C Gram-positive bacteria)]
MPRDSAPPTTTVVLGSASPARFRVLTGAGLRPTVVVSDVDEDALLDDLTGAPHADVVTRLAEAKADAVTAAVLAGAAPGGEADCVILTCDSMLLTGGVLAGKPHTGEVAVARWKQMRGTVGHLITGHCVRRVTDGAVAASVSRSETTAIRFSDAPDHVIASYAATGEPLEVAGAFTLDGLGGWLIDGIDGDPSSVLGISLPLVRRLLADVGVCVTDLWQAP